MKRCEIVEEHYYEKYFRYLYSSRRRLKRRVLFHERVLAKTIGHKLGLLYLLDSSKFNLNSDIEWMLTWKLKVNKNHEIMWCDGIEKLLKKRISKY